VQEQRASTPWLESVHLQWFGDDEPPAPGTPAGPDPGQGDGNGGGIPQGTLPAPASSFHSWTDPEGKVLSFKDQKELDNHLRSTYFRHDKFTQNMQELAAERQRLTALAQSLDGMGKEYEPFKQMRERFPSLYQEFVQRMKQGQGPRDVDQSLRAYVDQALKKVVDQFSPYKDQLDEQRFLREVDDTYGELEKEIPGFDRKKVDELAQLLGTQKTRKELFKRLHLSLMGEMDPAERLRLKQEQEEKERQADLGSRASPGQPPPPKINTVEEGRQAALREIKAGR
jgi:hypothetical protein